MFSDSASPVWKGDHLWLMNAAVRSIYSETLKSFQEFNGKSSANNEAFYIIIDRPAKSFYLFFIYLCSLR